MTDLLVKLYELPDPWDRVRALSQKGICVRRAMASEKKQVVDWVRGQFGSTWSAECDVAFARQPIACTIGVFSGKLIGFACHDATCRNFFGPIGVDPSFREKKVGHAILLVTLQAMTHLGYAYAIIGSAGPTAFFEKCAGATAIPGSTPGIYPSLHEQIQHVDSRQ